MSDFGVGDGEPERICTTWLFCKPINCLSVIWTLSNSENSIYRKDKQAKVGKSQQNQHTSSKREKEHEVREEGNHLVHFAVNTCCPNESKSKGSVDLNLFFLPKKYHSAMFLCLIFSVLVGSDASSSKQQKNSRNRLQNFSTLLFLLSFALSA